MRDLQIFAESFPVRGSFTISRGSRTQIEVLRIEIREGADRGQAECVPYPRYGESIVSVRAQIEAQRSAIAGGADQRRINRTMPPGAARNALDCALWDLAAKQVGRRVWSLLGRPEPPVLTSAYTLSLDAPDAMADAARQARARALLKIKLGGDDADLARVEAVRLAAPNSRLIVDANESWPADMVADWSREMARLGVALIEQPLPADADEALAGFAHPVPICADESCHDVASLNRLDARYEAINIKLDKTGGLSEALAVAEAARSGRLAIMVGCMLGTSLAMAPAIVVAAMADFVDLDGPLLLAEDRQPALRYEGSLLHPPSRALWG